MFPAPPPSPFSFRAQHPAPGRVSLVTLVVPLSAHAPALQLRCARGIPFALLMCDSQRRCGKRAPSPVVALRRQFRTLLFNSSMTLVGSVCFRRRGQGHQKPGFPTHPATQPLAHCGEFAPVRYLTTAGVRCGLPSPPRALLVFPARFWCGGARSFENSWELLPKATPP